MSWNTLKMYNSFLFRVWQANSFWYCNCMRARICYQLLYILQEESADKSYSTNFNPFNSKTTQLLSSFSFWVMRVTWINLKSMTKSNLRERVLWYPKKFLWGAEMQHTLTEPPALRIPSIPVQIQNSNSLPANGVNDERRRLSWTRATAEIGFPPKSSVRRSVKAAPEQRTWLLKAPPQRSCFPTRRYHQSPHGSS